MMWLIVCDVRQGECERLHVRIVIDMFIRFTNMLATSFDDRPHDDLTFCTGIVSFGDDVACEGIPARLCQCQASCLKQIWLGQFHLGFKIPNGFIEVEPEFAYVRGVACGHCHWCVVVQ